jgi:dTMP kinase
MRGILLTLEGIEGSGKSTQAARLGEHLRARGVPVVLTREPGGSPLAERIRGLLLTVGEEPLDPRAELLLFLAARAQHLRSRIVPALEGGRVVVCDRFTDATFAYQGGGRTMPDELLRSLNAWTTGGVTPDRTYLLDVPVELGLGRARARLGAGAGPDRIESLGAAFFEGVRKRYLALAAAEPERIRVLRGTDSEEALAHQILEDVDRILGDRTHTSQR